MGHKHIRLKLPNHIQDMIQYRNLSADHIRLAIRESDWTKDVLNGRLKSCKQLEKGRAIRVVYYKDGFRDTNDFIVITAYYTDNC